MPAYSLSTHGIQAFFPASTRTYSLASISSHLPRTKQLQEGAPSPKALPVIAWTRHQTAGAAMTAQFGRAAVCCDLCFRPDSFITAAVAPNPKAPPGTYAHAASVRHRGVICVNPQTLIFHRYSVLR